MGIDAEKLNNPQTMALGIHEIPMELDLDPNGQINRVTQTVLGMVTVSKFTYISFDNSKIAASSPPTPDESTLDTNLTFQDALIQEIQFFKSKPQSPQQNGT